MVADRTHTAEKLDDSFYRTQRDTLQEENHRLRDRIKFLEEKIRCAAWEMKKALAELDP